MKPVILAICGKAGCGKDTLARHLSSCPLGITNIISDTTRPPRVNEKHGVDYYFLSLSDFMLKESLGRYIEWTEFQGWFYGTPKDSICGKINVGVFNPQGIKSLYHLQKAQEYEVIPVYIKTPFWQRIQRYIKRDGKFSFECIRRLFADIIAFDNFGAFVNLFPQHIVLKNFKTKEDFLSKAQDIVFHVLAAYYR